MAVISDDIDDFVERNLDVLFPLYVIVCFVFIIGFLFKDVDGLEESQSAESRTERAQQGQHDEPEQDKLQDDCPLCFLHVAILSASAYWARGKTGCGIPLTRITRRGSAEWIPGDASDTEQSEAGVQSPGSDQSYVKPAVLKPAARQDLDFKSAAAKTVPA